MFLERLNDWARAAPGRTALIYNDRRLGYAELVRAIEASRRVLARAAPAGGVAAVLAQNSLNAWVLTAAARALGLTTVVANTMDRVRELGLRDVRCLICADDERALLNAGVASAIPIPAEAINDPGRLPASESHVQVGAAGGHILYTSGTTGASKKLLFDAAGEDARAKVRAATGGFSPETIFHALDFGLWTGVGFKIPIAVWSEGGCVVIDQRRTLYRDFLRYRPTYAQTLPETLRGIVDAAGPEASPVDHLLLRVGGGFTPLALAEAAAARVSTKVVVGFAASELPTVVMQARFRSAVDLLWLMPTDPAATKIVDEQGAELPEGAEGELRFQLSDTDTMEYLDDPEATAKAFRDGYFYSGDLAVRRADGRIRVLGRVGDVINIKGQKVAAGPIEQSIQQGLGVDEVCLFLGMASDGVEELVVAVRSAVPLDRDNLLDRLGPSKLFDRVRVEVFAEFPRTASGTAKTRRTELRRLVFPGEAAATAAIRSE